MQTDSDLVEAVEELDAEFNTQHVKDKIDSTPPSLPLSRPWAGVGAWQLVHSPLSA